MFRHCLVLLLPCSDVDKHHDSRGSLDLSFSLWSTMGMRSRIGLAIADCRLCSIVLVWKMLNMRPRWHLSGKGERNFVYA